MTTESINLSPAGEPTIKPTVKQYWAVIPAAGVGQRMAADRPKQYLLLHEKTILEQTLDRLLSMDLICGAVLSVSENDTYWPALNYHSKKPILIASGGKERSDSVLNALELLAQYQRNQHRNAQQTWALVHDAARPCVRIEDIEKLINTTSCDMNGGLLALPVRDTMKRANDDLQVQETAERNGLWHALTPQMFRLDLLIAALLQAQEQGQMVTDDASAMELAGYHPQLIEAHEDNIKITRAFDLQLADLYLYNQAK